MPRPLVTGDHVAVQCDNGTTWAQGTLVAMPSQEREGLYLVYMQGSTVALHYSRVRPWDEMLAVLPTIEWHPDDGIVLSAHLDPAEVLVTAWQHLMAED